MKLINSYDDFNNMLCEIGDEEVIIFPIFDNTKNMHYKLNNIIMLYIHIISKEVDYVAGFGHYDLYQINKSDIKKIRAKKIWTDDSKWLYNFIDGDIFDLSMYYYLYTNKIPNWKYNTTTHNYFGRKYDIRGINCVVPSVKHIEIFQHNKSIALDILNTFEEPFSFKLYQDFIYTAYEVESVGLGVDYELLKESYNADVDDLLLNKETIFTDYNFYTATGRPSNRFGNINFAAINKNDNRRKSFISKNGTLLLFDYDSFHLNLISKLIGYKFDENNLHTHLGKYYFNKEQLSDEEYNESKKMNFKYLYGGVPKSIGENIPFFNSVKQFYNNMWKESIKNGYYVSPLSGRRIYINNISKASPTKLFNYLIQLLETEINFIIIKKILAYIKQYNSKLILYTYDSFLFDIDLSEKDEVVSGIYNIIKVFPFKTYIGYNYNDMSRI